MPAQTAFFFEFSLRLSRAYRPSLSWKHDHFSFPKRNKNKNKPGFLTGLEVCSHPRPGLIRGRVNLILVARVAMPVRIPEVCVIA